MYVGIKILMITISFLFVTLMPGCKKKPDILGQEPVIPLVESSVSENTEGKDGNKTDSETDDLSELMSDGTADDMTYDTADESADKPGEAEGSYISAEFPELHVEGEYEEYEVSGIQLNEEQLAKLSAFFNLKEVNPYLMQVYLIPQDYDETLETEWVNITCVGGSYDSNRLYSVFYKKEGSNALWNVVMRRKDSDDAADEDDDPGIEVGDYRFHSNQMLADE
jgi:hypothetical protein